MVKVAEAKILHMPKRNGKQTIEEFMAESVKVIKAENIDCLVIAGKSKEGCWVTGYYNADFGVKHEALGHIQADIVDQMVSANFERYIDDE